VSFDESWEGKEKAVLEINDEIIETYIIGLDQLIKNKESINRNKDLDDLKYLRAVQKERRKHGT
jgi:hypothetical protein